MGRDSLFPFLLIIASIFKCVKSGAASSRPHFCANPFLSHQHDYSPSIVENIAIGLATAKETYPNAELLGLDAQWPPGDHELNHLDLCASIRLFLRRGDDITRMGGMDDEYVHMYSNEHVWGLWYHSPQFIRYPESVAFVSGQPFTPEILTGNMSFDAAVGKLRRMGVTDEMLQRGRVSFPARIMPLEISEKWYYDFHLFVEPNGENHYCEAYVGASSEVFVDSTSLGSRVMFGRPES